MRTSAAIPALALILAVASGCARGGEGATSTSPSASAAPSPSVTVPATPSAPSSPSAPPSPGASPGAGTTPGVPVPSVPGKVSPKPPIGEGRPITVTGTVHAGVEHGCQILRSGSLAWVLVGGDRTVVRPGARIRVTGTVSVGRASTCQQGQTLVVQKASAA